MTKLDERREMQKLMEERDKQTPARTEPEWVLNFWSARGTTLT
jgi:hypothetical protein